MQRDPKSGRWKKITEEEYHENVVQKNSNTYIFCFVLLIIPWIFICWLVFRNVDFSGTSLKLAESAVCGNGCVCSCPSSTPPLNPKTGF